MICPHCKKIFTTKYERESLADEIIEYFGFSEPIAPNYKEYALRGADFILDNFVRKEK